MIYSLAIEKALDEAEADNEKLRANVKEIQELAVEKLQLAADIIRVLKAKIAEASAATHALAETSLIQGERLAELQPLADLAWRFNRGDARSKDALDGMEKFGKAEADRRRLRS